MICHIFKPERCHHCSRCKTCILGMDHHCPWLGVCVGFRNRKYFILLLVYTIICIIQLLGFNLPVIIKICQFSFATKVTPTNTYLTIQTIKINSILILIIYLGCLIFLFLIGNFLKFHLVLLFNNNTTLEYLRSIKDKTPITKEFNIGCYENFVQVFGKRKILWPFPVDSIDRKYDGVHFPKSNINNELI